MLLIINEIDIISIIVNKMLTDCDQFIMTYVLNFYLANDQF